MLEGEILKGEMNLSLTTRTLNDYTRKKNDYVQQKLSTKSDIASSFMIIFKISIHAYRLHFTSYVKAIKMITNDYKIVLMIYGI